jgi:dolichyl-phosphate beta-glucosyltransferase
VNGSTTGHRGTIGDPPAAEVEPFLSVVVPVLDEEATIGRFIALMREALATLVPSWEIVIVDDGSVDGTRAIAQREAHADPRIRVVGGVHGGKGAALRLGMLDARGRWRFMADADLAMPPDNLSRFLELVASDRPPDLVIGSREAAGAQRIGESMWRHVVGRVFNWIVRVFAVRGIRDTQCGFKLFSAAAAQSILSRLTTTGFACDVEMLLLAQRSGLTTREVGIVWRAGDDSRVRFGRGAAAFADILRIRWRWRNRWAVWAYAVTAVFAAAIAYDLLRMPVQVFDSLAEIVDAYQSPSIWSSFEGALGTTAYLRPLRIAQIKALFDLASGDYWLAYRGFHAALLVLCLYLFTRALRVRTSADLAAAMVALTVLTGMSTFRGTVQEAFPINHFLEMVVGALAVLNLAQSRGGWWVDVAAAAIFAASALTLESGVLVWVVAVAARMSGMTGVSRRGIAAVSLLLAGYFYLRFGSLMSGTPGLSERSSGFLLSVLDPDELEGTFGSSPHLFYAYNVFASAFAVLFSEPRSGVFVAVRSWLQGNVPPHVVLAIASSTMTTLLIAWTSAHCVKRRALDSGGQLIVVAALVLAANAVLSYAYTKDEVMSVAGAFYALAAFAATRFAIRQAEAMRAVVLGALCAVMLLNGGIWAVRSAGLHHVLRLQAFRHRGDWAVLPARLEAEGRSPGGPSAAVLVDALRTRALTMEAPNPAFYARWAEPLWGD